jgi:hypothetical protein
MKYGKKPAAPQPSDLRFGNYVDRPSLPALPDTFGHGDLFPTREWGVLGNDDWGDCGPAGEDHAEKVLTTLGGNPAPFTTETAEALYSAVTGFDPQAGPPGENPTDQGTDIHALARYRRKTGAVDANGRYHRIGAYVWLEPGNWEELLYGTYLFQVAGIGWELQEAQERQFQNNETWDYEEGSPVVGGHWTISPEKERLVSWGTLCPFTQKLYEKQNDEGLVYISREVIVDGKDPNGFRAKQLFADLELLDTVAIAA